MKHLLSLLLTLGIFATHDTIWAQNKADSTGKKDTSSSNYNYFTLDVGKPRGTAMRGSNTDKRLESWSSDLIGIQLVHANPFKYKYKIDATFIDLFEEPVAPTGSGSKSASTSTPPVAEVSASKIIGSGVGTVVPSSVTQAVDDYKKAIKAPLEIAYSKEIKEASTPESLQTIVNNAKGAIPNPSVSFNAILKIADDALKPVNSLNASIDKVDKAITENYTDIKAKQDTTKSSTVNSSPADSAGLRQTTPISETKLSVLTAPIDADKPTDEKLTELWNKLLQTIDINLSKMQEIQQNMRTYILYIKTLDDFENRIFASATERFRNAINAEVFSYNRIINDFNSVPLKDADGKFKIFQTKSEQFNTVKAACDEMLTKFYTVQQSYYMLPIDIEGKNIDLVEFKLQRLDATTAANVDEYKYQIWIKGGLKFDISAGGFLSSLMDDEYIAQDVENETKKKIVKDDKGSYKLGFGSMVNMSYRMGRSWWRPGLSLGLLFTTAESFQILAGPSFVLGKTERVVLHFGIAMGNVSRLRPEYQEGGLYTLESTGAVPTTKMFEVGHFFGLTYNLSKVKSAPPTSSSN